MRLKTYSGFDDPEEPPEEDRGVLFPWDEPDYKGPVSAPAPTSVATVPVIEEDSDGKV